jgi:hypothetical protein
LRPPNVFRKKDKKKNVSNVPKVNPKRKKNLPVVNGLGKVPVGSIPTNNLKNQEKKALVKFSNAISTTTLLKKLTV